MRKNLLFLVLLMLTMVSAAWAQDRVVSGKITGTDGSPLPGVSVVVKGVSGAGTASNVTGEYKISIPAGSTTLIYSFIGYKTQEVAIGDRSVIDVQLADNVQQLEEVVVTGYGTTTRREVTGSISSVRGEAIQNIPMQSFDRAIQGRMSGVQITGNSGTPGGAVQVRIRGTGSILAGNDPLYIVDGVQLNGSQTRSALTSVNPLNFLNPNDIESIDVIKDAATAAIYGAQASNGVVIVTTKKGKAGKTKFNFNTYMGIQDPFQRFDVANSQEVVSAIIEAGINGGRTRGASLSGIRLGGPGVVANTPVGISDAEIAALPTYDWQAEVYRRGIIRNYELSASGGSDKTTFFISASYNRTDAAVRFITFDRMTARTSIRHQLNSKMDIEANLNLASTFQTGPFGGPDGGTALGSPAFSSPMILPFNPPRNEDGSYFGLPPAGIAGILNQNPLAVGDYNTINSRNNQIVGNFAYNAQLLKGLRFRSFYGLDYSMINGERYTDPRTPDGFGFRGRGFAQNDIVTNFITNQVFTYETKFAEKLSFNGLAGFEYRSDINTGINASADNFPTQDFRTLNSAAIPLSVGQFWTGYRRTGIFSELKLDWDKRFFVAFVGRYDGSSRFGTGNVFGFFPSVRAAYALNRDLENVTWIDELKLRASYGVTGNDQIGNFAARGLVGAGPLYIQQSGIVLSSLPNPNLRWERNTSIDLAADYAFFKRRLYGSVGVFRRMNSDLLLSRALPTSNGIGTFSENVGEVWNEGIELEISGDIIRTPGGLTWNSSFNITALRNRVKELYNNLQVLPGAGSTRVGFPLETNVVIPYAGVNPATGRPMWYDRDNNLTYLPRGADISAGGDARPEHSNLSTTYGGWTNTLSYKGFELTVFFQYDYGRVGFDNAGAFLSEIGGRNFNFLRDTYYRRWTAPGQITDVPQTVAGNAHVRAGSNIAAGRFFQDASYIRLKQLVFSYRLQPDWLSKVKLSSARIYIQSTNVGTWTNWQGLDPEWVNSGNGNNGLLPQSRQYIAGIEIGF